MTDDPPPALVSTHTAARTLGTRRHTLAEWADAGFVTAATVDDQGCRVHLPQNNARTCLPW